MRAIKKSLCLPPPKVNTDWLPLCSNAALAVTAVNSSSVRCTSSGAELSVRRALSHAKLKWSCPVLLGAAL